MFRCCYVPPKSFLVEIIHAILTDRMIAAMHSRLLQSLLGVSVRGNSPAEWILLVVSSEGVATPNFLSLKFYQKTMINLDTLVLQLLQDRRHSRRPVRRRRDYRISTGDLSIVICRAGQD